ncbi:MAG: hypothetical protein RMY29_005990 [Nostoc sp. CreGUA01]|nr:hypothetical protein [Nostoc sp. CreGUA01]
MGIGDWEDFSPAPSHQYLVQQGKSKKSKVKRKNTYTPSFLPILDGGFISTMMY